MESDPFESPPNQPVKHSVRDRIISFHDAYLKVSPISERTAAGFQEVASSMRSKLGREIVERLKPTITTRAKNFEVGLATIDMIVGLVTTGFGVRGLAKARKGERTSEAAGAALKWNLLDKAQNMRWRKAGFLTVVGGSLFLVRPITRLTNIAVLPITKRAALWVDAILLRKEQRTSYASV